jgi:hypothetical protein
LESSFRGFGIGKIGWENNKKKEIRGEGDVIQIGLRSKKVE